MQLIGQAICHEIFGKGVVTGWDENILTVCFRDGGKKFIYPDAFSEHLTLHNSAMQREIQGLLIERAAEREAEQQAVQKERERKSRLRNLKISPISQAAFNITAEQETAVFSEWAVSAGTYLSGGSKGEPRIPDRLKPNSLCLLTKREMGTPERDRRVIGAFMVEEDFLGACCQNGIINAHPVHRITLPRENHMAPISRRIS